MAFKIIFGTMGNFLEVALEKEDSADAVDVRVGSNIRFARLGKGFSEAEFADLLGMSAGNICDLEAGRSSARPFMLIKIAQMTGQTVAALLHIAIDEHGVTARQTAQVVNQDERTELLNSYDRIQDDRVRLRMRRLMDELALPSS